jgi:phosphatidylinositol alpha-1,6-mannosyltransferase
VDLRPDLKIKYYLIGHGKEATNLKSLTKRLGLETYVVFLTNVDNETRNEYYTISNLFILPSKVRPNATEGFGIVFLEANFYKIPVIGTKTGGIVDAIIDGETGFLIRSNDLEELVIKILNLIDNEDLRIKMGEIGYKRVIKEFLWEDIVNDYINAFSRFN